MSTTKPREQRDNQDQRKTESSNTLIRDQVIHALGKPNDLLLVQVRPLWGSRYRVNVFVGADAASARLANSYFLTADEDGKIITSTPPITKPVAVVAESGGAKT